MAGDPGSIRLYLYSYDGSTQYDAIWPCTTVKIENNCLYYDGLEGYIEDEPDIDVQGSISGFALTANGEVVCSNNTSYNISELAYDTTLYVKTAVIYKHITLSDGTKIQVDSAVRDEYGNRIDTIYALKTDLSDLSYDDVVISNDD